MRDDQWDPGDPSAVNESALQLPARDLVSTKPEPTAPPQYTRAQLGKLRRQYVTIVHSTVVACDHTYDPNRPPRNNCFWCWQAFFRTNLEAVHTLLQEHGHSGMTRVYGEKFVKMFKRFLADELLPEESTDASPA